MPIRDTWARTTDHLERHLLLMFVVVYAVAVVSVLVTGLTLWPEGMLAALGPAIGATIGARVGQRRRSSSGNAIDPRRASGPAIR